MCKDVARRTYFNASYPEPWVILGIRLRPFSFGHYLKLRQFDNAFVAEDSRNATLGDLLLGVAVCSMSSDPDPSRDEFWCWITEPAKFHWMAWLMGKKPLAPSERDILKWGKTCKTDVDLAEKCKMFQNYLEEHSKSPSYWILKEGGGKNSGAHWSHAIIHSLCARSGYTQQQAYNVPMSKALMDFYRSAEEEGVVRLMTEEEVVNGA